MSGGLSAPPRPLPHLNLYAHPQPGGQGHQEPGALVSYSLAAQEVNRERRGWGEDSLRSFKNALLYLPQQAINKIEHAKARLKGHG